MADARGILGHLVFGGAEAGQGDPRTARAVVLPLPMEATVTYGRGAAEGPRAILEASANMELFDEQAWRPCFRPGEVYTAAPIALPQDPAAAVEAIEAAARPHVQAGQFLLGLGGEHTVTVGLLRAVAARHPGIGVLQIDAHADLRDTYDGTPFSHACVARRILADLSLPLVQTGIRSLSLEEAVFLESRQGRGLRTFFAHARDQDGRWIPDAVDPLPEEVYVTLDVDGLDPGILPGTGTPEPGGLSYREALDLLREVARRRRIVAADIVEVAPIPGQTISEFTAARLAARMICLTATV